MRSPASLLNWTRRMVAVRRNHIAPSDAASLRFLYPANRKVLAYLRELDDERILCVANLSRAPQAVELDLSEFKGATPVEMTGGSRLPADRRPALSPHAAGLRLLLVPADRDARERSSASGRGRSLSSSRSCSRAARDPPQGPRAAGLRAHVVAALPRRAALVRRQGRGASSRAPRRFRHHEPCSGTGRGRDVFLLPAIEVELGGGERQAYFAAARRRGGRATRTSSCPTRLARVAAWPSRRACCYGAASSPRFRARRRRCACARRREIATARGRRDPFCGDGLVRRGDRRRPERGASGSRRAEQHLDRPRRADGAEALPAAAAGRASRGRDRAASSPRWRASATRRRCSARSSTWTRTARRRRSPSCSSFVRNQGDAWP